MLLEARLAAQTNEDGVVEIGLRRRVRKLQEKNTELQNKLDVAFARAEDAVAQKNEVVEARNQAQTVCTSYLILAQFLPYYARR